MLVDYPDRSHELSHIEKQEQSHYMTFGGCNMEVQKMDFEHKKTAALICAMQMIVREKCDPMVVHKALLPIIEYEDAFSDDVPGVDAYRW